MDIKDLQKAWNKLSDKTSEQQMLNEEQIRNLLRSRTTTLLDRIDRNIRIGFVVLLVVILGGLVLDFLTVTGKTGGTSIAGEVPGWLATLDMSVNLLIVALFATFFIHYWKIRRVCRGVCDLRHTLMKTIGVLNLYRRLFALALAIILMVSATGFIAGYFTSIQEHNTMDGFFISALIIGLLLMLLFSGLLFLLLRWTFRKAYGNYLARLTETLAELDDLDDHEE